MESIHFQHIPELVHRYLKVPDPVILHYTIRPNEPPPTQPQAWDVEVLMEDTNFKGRLNSVLMSLGSDSAREITNLDEEVSLLHTCDTGGYMKRSTTFTNSGTILHVLII